MADRLSRQHHKILQIYSVFTDLCAKADFFVLQIGVRFAREEDAVPYMVSQPLPWQVHSVSHSRKSSKAEEVSAHNMHIPPVPEWSLISIDALGSD